MAYHLRRLGSGEGQQVIVTSHSPIFVGKVSDGLCQIVRIRRTAGVSMCGQLRQEALTDILGEGGALKKCLEDYVADPTIAEDKKQGARNLLKGSPHDEDIAAQEEKFRYQLWLDSERASMFFADRVLLVEGATEKALLGWLLARDWHDLTRHRIAVVDVMGKFNFHRYIALLEGFGIPYGLMLDEDEDKGHHKAINDMLRSRAGKHRLAEPVFIPGCIEKFLGMELPKRDDRKPVQMLKSLESAEIDKAKLDQLRQWFLQALALGKV